MRFNISEDFGRCPIGEWRRVRRFLWLPTIAYKIDGSSEVRWLETATMYQECIPLKSIGECGSLDTYGWVTRSFGTL